MQKDKDYKQHLIQLKAELEVALADAERTSATVVLDQNSVGRLSRMDAMQQQNMALANKRSLSVRLAKIHKALAALESGDYGYCETCGEEIGVARLTHYPESNLCLSCQSAQE